MQCHILAILISCALNFELGIGGLNTLRSFSLASLLKYNVAKCCIDGIHVRTNITTFAQRYQQKKVLKRAVLCGLAK